MFAVMAAFRPTPTQQAYAECRLCGLTIAEIDKLIDTIRQRALTREEELRLFDSTFTEDEHGPEGCMPCVEAILDAAGVE